jgi:hypothetical protein
MPDQYGLDEQDSDGTYLEGPLKGQTSVQVLIGASETLWMKHAAREVGYSFDRLVQIAAEEAALNHARDNNLINAGKVKP